MEDAPECRQGQARKPSLAAGTAKNGLQGQIEVPQT